MQEKLYDAALIVIYTLITHWRDAALITGYILVCVGFCGALMGIVQSIIPLGLGVGVWAVSGWAKRF